MTADSDTIMHLNAVLKNKLAGINQYFLHARMLKHMGHVKLADQKYKASIDAMKHSDMLVEHILSLGGLPNLKELGKMMIGENLDTMLENDLKHIESSDLVLKSAVAYYESTASHATIVLLNKILESQHEHSNFIRTQINQVTKDCA